MLPPLSALLMTKGQNIRSKHNLEMSEWICIMPRRPCLWDGDFTIGGGYDTESDVKRRGYV
jgi:hypothetical protein